MSVLEEVRQMQQQGATEQIIVNALREKGISYKDISEALAQTEIKAAVEDPGEFQQSNSGLPEGNIFPQQEEAIPGLQQSLTQQPYGESQNPQDIQEQSQEYIPPPQSIPPPSPSKTMEYTPQYEDYYSQAENYQPYDSQSVGISTDTITEISEQIVSEKMMDIRKALEKILDFKTTIDAKVENIDDRIKRIEKIIDTLQSSVLRKVGDYVTNVEDIKKELIETQKSFSKFFPELKKQSNHEHHKQHSKKKHKEKKK